MLKIYGHQRSRMFRVVWLCKELNLPFEHVEVTTEGAAPGCREDWYRRLNPAARVPTIDDDGYVLWESAAINIYLAKKYPNTLWPTTLGAEGRMLQWAFFVAHDIERPIATLHEHRFALPQRERNPAVADECERRLVDRLGILERQLEKTPCFGGIRWDLSDFMVASVLYTVYAMRMDLVHVPKVDRWLTRSVQRPAARDAIKLREG
jgi:glutathione S-transferase